MYVDTEGFESTGKSNSYDDRIFALSALLSSLLVYNLPETIRESDVAKLSFAVELAQGFYEHDLGSKVCVRVTVCVCVLKSTRKTLRKDSVCDAAKRLCVCVCVCQCVCVEVLYSNLNCVGRGT